MQFDGAGLFGVGDAEFFVADGGGGFEVFGVLFGVEAGFQILPLCAHFGLFVEAEFEGFGFEEVVGGQAFFDGGAQVGGRRAGFGRCHFLHLFEHGFDAGFVHGGGGGDGYAGEGEGEGGE